MYIRLTYFTFPDLWTLILPTTPSGMSLNEGLLLEVTYGNTYVQ